jgi:hypothetical protein
VVGNGKLTGKKQSIQDEGTAIESAATHVPPPQAKSTGKGFKIHF